MSNVIKQAAKRPRRDSTSESDMEIEYEPSAEDRPETRNEAAKKAEEERNEDMMHLCYYNDVDGEYEVARGDKSRCTVCNTKIAKKVRINLRNG